MDENPLDEYITLLQNKTMIVDSYSRELQSYTSLFKSLKVELSEDQFNEVEKLMLIATDSCDELDVKVQNIVKCLQKFLIHTHIYNNPETIEENRQTLREIRRSDE